MDYKNKIITVGQALDMVKSGMRIALGDATVEPQAFLENIHTIADRVKDVELTNCLGLRSYPFMENSAYHDSFILRSLFFSKPTREAEKYLRVSYVPCHLRHTAPPAPAGERRVRELLGCEPSHTLNPDECVAMGAAVQGGLLQGGGKLAGATGAAAQGLVLMDVTPLTLSIETLGGVATPLITRNSMIPTRKSQIFTTARPMQTSVEINVLQGERHFARDNKSLGKFKLTGIRSGFSSKPQIEVTFDIDVNGVVKVSAKDLGTGREQNITITGSTNLSENEIQRAMADAAAYEEEDTRRRERLELHNQAEMLAYKVDEALSKCKKELDKDEKNRVKNDLAGLRRCLRKDKPEKMNETEEANLRQAKSQLEASANHLMVLYSTEQDAGRQ